MMHDAIPGALITDARLGKWSAWQISSSGPWSNYQDADVTGRPVTSYPDEPGMDAMKALRRFFDERAANEERATNGGPT